jgi:RHH-type proline utilization regulon transcriptional repressor/proline dehydrogenase/delta 1-pyrroline-5-carboxylate dehydrogenase
MEIIVKETIVSTNEPRSSSAPSQSFQQEVRATGEQIFRLMEGEGSSIFNKDWWYGRIMEWSMKNEKFKVQMFRFVDVLPYLDSSSEVARHMKEYFSEGGEALPSVFNFGLGIGSLAPSLLAGAVKKNVTQMAQMFIAGSTPREATPQLLKNRERNIAFTVDLLGEATLSEKEALEYQRRYMELITQLALESEKWPAQSQIDQNHLGSIPKVNVSVKLSALYSQINLKAWEHTKTILKERLRPVLQLAKERNVFINLDMEQYSLKELTLEVFGELLMEPAFQTYPHFGVVIQAYLKDSLADIDQMIKFSKERGTPFTIRLVKGAYWEYETVDAKQKNWPVPVYENKPSTDANFEACAKRLLDHHRWIHSAIASHNVRSVASVLVYAKRQNIPLNAFEIQMLFGMADQIKRALTKMGVRVRQYTPIGELIPGMAYLVRRLLENTSNESFLRSKFADNVSTEKLLEEPNPVDPKPAVFKDRFENVPLLDFTHKDVRQKMQDALEQTKRAFSKTSPIIINGKELKSQVEIESINPSHSPLVYGKVYAATQEQADQAVTAAHAGLKTWAKLSVAERSSYWNRVADIMSERRYELASVEVHEVGKSWSEADGDVAEAIDFCRYYAREAIRLAKPQRAGWAPGEDSQYFYQPRGVVAVIAPWNFPLAILTGMVAAASVTGNTVVMKPAEQSSLIAVKLMDILKEAKLPPEAVHFLPGYGEDVGEQIVNHPLTSLIAFTGSRDVGLRILQKAAVIHPNQNHVKKCIIEMGGKNAIIIDSDADLDEAVLGVIYSAFGYQGQKCSACSRVIVLDEIYDRFKERLIEAARSVAISTSEDPVCVIGPVIDEEAQKRIQKTIAENKQKYKVLFEGTTPAGGYFVAPTIFDDVDPSSSLAQEEIFGPVLAMIRARNIDHALEIANGTKYALTGGLYSRSPAHIEKVRSAFEVGNLYINRGSTGALVERHPFGGFKMSGVGSKTGGPDYLLQFVEPRVVTENTLRRGFAPTE